MRGGGGGRTTKPFANLFDGNQRIARRLDLGRRIASGIHPLQPSLKQHQECLCRTVSWRPVRGRGGGADESLQIPGPHVVVLVVRIRFGRFDQAVQLLARVLEQRPGLCEQPGDYHDQMPSAVRYWRAGWLWHVPSVGGTECTRDRVALICFTVSPLTFSWEWEGTRRAHALLVEVLERISDVLLLG